MYRKRKFPTDLAGFAIHLRLIHQYSNYVFNVSVNSIAQQESQILDTMTTMDQLECLANNASKVLIIVLRKENFVFEFVDLCLAYENSIDVFNIDRKINKCRNHI
jgi:hypothetical protein